MPKRLVLIGGWFNLCFAVFHVALAYAIWTRMGLAPGPRALMELLAVGGTLMIAMFTVVSLRFPAELVTTGLGRVVLWTVVAVYGTRAIGEVVFTAQPSPLIMVVCAGLALLYAVAGLSKQPR